MAKMSRHQANGTALLHRRRLGALGLTGFALALGVVLITAYGRDALIIYLWGLPLALILLWMSTSAERFDEGEEDVSPSVA